MKNLSWVFNALIISSFIFIGCKKDESEQVIVTNGGITITPVQALTCNAGGNPFQAATIVHELLDGTTHVFVATSLTGEVWTLRINDLTPGTYAVDLDIPTITLFTGGYLYDQSPGATGSIVISTNVNSRITGTFVTAVNNIAETGQTIELLEGVFTDLSY